MIVIGVMGVITFLYAIPFLPKRILFDKNQNLRQISGLKIYVIGLVWAVVTVILPLVNASVEISADVYMSSIQRFLLVLVLMLPFEIRDLNYDNLKLATIPQLIGIKKTKAIGMLLLIVFFLLEYLKDDLQTKMIVSNLAVVFLLLLLLAFSRKDQSKYYSAFWVESVPIFWLAILLLLR